MSELEFMKIFAGNLQSLMYETGYSQAELAEETNISQGTISKYLSAKQMPSVKAIVNFVYVFNCDFEDLMDFGDMIDMRRGRY